MEKHLVKTSSIGHFTNDVLQIATKIFQESFYDFLNRILKK